MPIFQPYIVGQEFSVDVYINRLGKPQGALARIRELVIDGESQMTSSLHYPELEALCLNAANRLGIYGHAVFQAIRDSNHQLHLIECNPRFGGASTLSIAMGLKSFEWFFQESLNSTLPSFTRSAQEMRLIRYPEDMVIFQ